MLVLVKGIGANDGPCESGARISGGVRVNVSASVRVRHDAPNFRASAESVLMMGLGSVFVLCVRVSVSVRHGAPNIRASAECVLAIGLVLGSVRCVRGVVRVRLTDRASAECVLALALG